MTRLSGRLAPVLSVTEPAVSAEWYGRVLDFSILRQVAGPNGRVLDVCLEQKETGIEMCLVGHLSNTGEPFKETRTGLDHLEFIVDDREDLDEWAARLDQLGIPHSGVKVAPASKNAMITFRDPDSIQLELFWRAGEVRPKRNGHVHLDRPLS